MESHGLPAEISLLINLLILFVRSEPKTLYIWYCSSRNLQFMKPAVSTNDSKIAFGKTLRYLCVADKICTTKIRNKQGNKSAVEKWDVDLFKKKRDVELSLKGQVTSSTIKEQPTHTRKRPTSSSSPRPAPDSPRNHVAFHSNIISSHVIVRILKYFL
jgi:hypothetical protein